MLTWPLIYEGVELEVDLVVAGGQIDDEAVAVITSLETVDEALGQAEREQVSGARVQPLCGDREVAGNSVPGSAETVGQWISAIQIAVAAQSDDVDIPGRPLDYPQGKQTRAPDDNQLVVLPRAGQLLAEGVEKAIHGFLTVDVRHLETRR